MADPNTRSTRRVSRAEVLVITSPQTFLLGITITRLSGVATVVERSHRSHGSSDADVIALVEGPVDHEAGRKVA